MSFPYSVSKCVKISEPYLAVGCYFALEKVVALCHQVILALAPSALWLRFQFIYGTESNNPQQIKYPHLVSTDGSNNAGKTNLLISNVLCRMVVGATGTRLIAFIFSIFCTDLWRSPDCPVLLPCPARKGFTVFWRVSLKTESHLSVYSSKGTVVLHKAMTSILPCWKKLSQVSEM